jgi:hypothetical protein
MTRADGANGPRSIAKRRAVVNRGAGRGRALGLAAALATALATVLVGTRPSAAHPEFNPVVINRYIKLTLVARDQVRLAYTVMFGAGPAEAERKLADANGDGRVDEAERRALGARLAGQLTSGLALEVDGRPLAPGFAPPEVGLAGDEVGPSPFSIDLIARVSLPPAERHTLRFDDQTSVPLLGETEVRVEEGPTTRLIAAHRGRGGVDKETRFLFRGPRFSALEDRSIELVFAAAAADNGSAPAGDGGRRRGAWIALGVGGLVLAAWALLVAARSRSAARYRNMKG